MTGNLTPASHAGYDLLLDLTDVASARTAACQPCASALRLGTNTVYLEPGGAGLRRRSAWPAARRALTSPASTPWPRP